MRPLNLTRLGAPGIVIVLAGLATVTVKQRATHESDNRTVSGFNVSHRPERPSELRRSSRGDLQQALRQILAERNPRVREARLREWTDGIGIERMPSVVRGIGAPLSEILQAEVRQALFTSWTERDLDGALTWFGKHAPMGTVDGRHLTEMVRAVQSLDADKTLQTFKNKLPKEALAEWHGAYFREWTLAAPAAAAAKLMELTQNETGNPAAWNDLLSRTTALWVESDPLAAVTWMQSLPEGAAKIHAETQAAYRWTELDPGESSAYAAAQDNPQLHQIIAAKWAETNPAAAIAWATALSANRPESRALAQASAIWAQTDPKAAATYASSLPENEFRKQVSGAVATAWAITDPEALGKWVSELPVSSSRDSALDALCAALLPTAPGEAFQWADMITDISERGDHLERAASEWLASDPAVAREAITRSTMDEEAKRRVLAESAP